MMGISYFHTLLGAKTVMSITRVWNEETIFLQFWETNLTLKLSNEVGISDLYSSVNFIDIVCCIQYTYIVKYKFVGT